jgi:hypothetical protein
MVSAMPTIDVQCPKCGFGNAVRTSTGKTIINCKECGFQWNYIPTPSFDSAEEQQISCSGCPMKYRFPTQAIEWRIAVGELTFSGKCSICEHEIKIDFDGDYPYGKIYIRQKEQLPNGCGFYWLLFLGLVFFGLGVWSIAYHLEWISELPAQKGPKPPPSFIGFILSLGFTAFGAFIMRGSFWTLSYDKKAIEKLRALREQGAPLPELPEDN